MKASRVFVGVLAGLLAGLPLAEAQSQCNAVVTKDSINPNQQREKRWDIQFNVAVSGCAASHGKFEYVVELDVASGPPRSKKEIAPFDIEPGGSTKVMVTYEAAPGTAVRNVTGMKVTECICAK